MSSYFTDAQGELFANIIGHVESNNDYSAFIAAGTNSSSEKAITIGCYQFYGTNAKKLLQYIQTKYPTQFKKLDTAGIANDLESEDWSTYNCTKTSTKGRCIINIISSTAGKKCQDALFLESAEGYCKTATSKGVTDPQGMFMAANFIHQGGTSALTRILAKTTKPYNLENLYSACCTDTGNQVGVYKTRQKYVYEHLRDDWPEDSNSSSSSTTTTESTTTSSNSTSLSKTVQYTGYALMKLTPRKWGGVSRDSLTKVTSVAKGDSVKVCDTITGDDGKTWLYCKIESYYGFLPSSGISKTKPSSGYNKTAVYNAKVSTGGGTLNLRKGPSTTYDKLTSYPSVKNGTTLQICDSAVTDGTTWYYILYNGKYGFASSKYITLTSAC